ncbi:MAG: 2Fe-2S iron-sulfur cluster binding domain-containing protein [Comamonadaceae bacterium]|nr:MAG: 2Fe-2S iron-sulfur cluster binding domain-containing protein [Comamonadaceae bacterium]
MPLSGTRADGGAAPLSLVVNLRAVRLEVPREASLLHLLRNDLGLNGPKYGCGLGQCGACTVWVDGVAARACVIPAHGVAGRDVTTLEGLPAVAALAAAAAAALRSGHDEAPAADADADADAATAADAPAPRWHPVQAAFEEAQAAQCGYCLNGMVMQAAALLAREPDPSESRIRAELSGNLCRCGTHVEIVRAVRLAAMRIGKAPIAASP